MTSSTQQTDDTNRAQPGQARQSEEAVQAVSSAQSLKYGSAEAIAEHRACVDYHTALVNSRFTIAALYVAAMGFVAGAVFKKDSKL